MLLLSGRAGRVRKTGRARLLASASATVLIGVAAAATLGVSLAPAVRAGTVNPTQTSTYHLTAGDNPITFGPTTDINTSGGFGDAVQGDASANWTVTNQGNLTGYASGIFLTSRSDVTNSGSIVAGAGYFGSGVQLTQGGNVTNLAGGVIHANGDGVYLNAPGSVSNAGSVFGTTFGVLLGQGGTVVNSGSIAGGSIDVYVQGGPGDVTNSGTLTGSAFSYTVKLTGGGAVNNQSGGSISGGPFAVLISGGAGTVTNAGNLSGTDFAVEMTGGGDVTNQLGGNIIGAGGIAAGPKGGGGAGVYLKTMAGNVSNAGSITGAGYGVYLAAGGSVTNDKGGAITGTGGIGYGSYSAYNHSHNGAIGVLISGAAGTVTNAGSIYGHGLGVDLAAGGLVTNNAGGNISGNEGVRLTAGGTVANYGLIEGLQHGPFNAFGVAAYNSPATVTNAGTILGDKLYGVSLNAGGRVTNKGGGFINGVYLVGGAVTLTNAGTIAGLRSGVYIGSYISPASATVTNTGNITAGPGLYAGVFGYRNSTVTLTNSGTITGADGAFFGAGGDVTNQTGGNITGVLVGLNIKGPANITNAGIILGATQTGIDLAGQGNVTNSGLVSGGKYGLLLASGDVTNQAGGVITGPSAGVEFSGAGVLSNAGLISAGNGPISFGVLVESDADVTNLAGGTITGTYALAIRGAGTVTNAGLIGGAATAGEALYIGKNALVTNQAGGSIASAGAYGIIINGAGTVINAAGATISSATASTGAYRGAALYISGPGNVTNAGAITAGGDATVGVYLEAGGLVTNSGRISGGQYGVYTAGNTTITNAAGGTISFTGNATAINKYSAVQVNGVGTVTNAGNISGAATIFAYGVRMSSGTLTNSGNIVVNGLASLAVDITGAGSVTNSGTIKGTLGVGIVTGNVTNLKTGAIAGSIEGIVMLTGTVTNAGYIGNRNGYAGIGIVKDGVIVNQAGGTISGGGFGIVGVIGNTTVTNAAGATISASGNSTTFASGFGLGVYIRSIGSITNAGTISAVGNTSGGIELRGGGTVVNTGVISGGLYGVTTAGIGLYGSTGGTVTNAGTISGGAASVVFLGNTTNVLTLETGSTLIGSAIGSAGAGATNAVVLQGHGVANNVFVNFNTLTVNASGVWALNGVSTIGATSINSGDLEVGDAGHPGAVLTSPVTINAGGTLSGHGTVAGSVVDNGGTVSPGGTIGTLTISGNLTLNAGSTTDIEIAPPSQSSLLMVAGTAALGGGVDFLADPGVYRKGEQFHFLTAGAIIGAFTSVVVSNGLPGSLVQGATTDTLTLLAGNFAPVGGTSNQNAIGAAVNDVPVGAGDFDAVANPLIALGPGAAQNHALDELGGEIYADTLSVGRQATRGFLATLGDRLEGADSGAAAQMSGATAGDPAVWGQVLGRFDRLSGDGNAHGFNANAGGLAFGASGVWGAATAGAALSWDETNLSLRGLPQSGRLDATQIAVYGEERFGGMVYVNGAASVGFTNGHGERAIAFTGVNRRATGDFDGTTVGLAANLGARMPMSDGWMAEPSVGIVYSSIRQGSVRESGAGSADLAVADRTQTASESVVAVRFANATPTGQGLLSADIKIAWAHDFSGVTPTVAEAFPVTPGAAFRLSGANAGKDAGLFSGGLNLAASRQLSVFARYDASIAQDDTEQILDLGLKFRW